MSLTVPLFPLSTVLFPAGVLPLRIFEPRYLDMVSDCLKHDTPIGVVLIKKGKEVGLAAETHLIGTLCEISYWNRRDDGLLGVTLKGTQRFRILSRDVKPNQLIIAEVELLDNVSDEPLPSVYYSLADMLRKIIKELEPPFTLMRTRYDDANWVSSRLVELLPLPLDLKQDLLVEANPLVRLEHISSMLNHSKAV